MNLDRYESEYFKHFDPYDDDTLVLDLCEDDDIEDEENEGDSQ